MVNGSVVLDGEMEAELLHLISTWETRLSIKVSNYQSRLNAVEELLGGME